MANPMDGFNGMIDFNSTNQVLDSAMNFDSMNMWANPNQGLNSLTPALPAVNTQTLLSNNGLGDNMQYATGASDLQETLFGGKNTTGYITGGANAIANLAQAWGALQQIDLGRDQLRFDRNLANRNLSNQATTINSQMRDRQQARLDAAGSGASRYESVENYMKRNGVDGSAV